MERHRRWLALAACGFTLERMAQRRFHYEQAFEHFLRANRVPYVAVDEAKKALVPTGVQTRRQRSVDANISQNTPTALKSFDFVVYAPGRNLLVDVKGRMFGSAKSLKPHCSSRYESWVTTDDVESLKHWQHLFGDDFTAVFIFAYCLRQQPPDALFEEVFTFADKWYALREVGLNDYIGGMISRSEKWQTVHVPAEEFARISRPFSVRSSSEAQRPCGG